MRYKEIINWKTIRSCKAAIILVVSEFQVSSQSFHTIPCFQLFTQKIYFIQCTYQIFNTVKMYTTRIDHVLLNKLYLIINNTFITECINLC